MRDLRVMIHLFDSGLRGSRTNCQQDWKIIALLPIGSLAEDAGAEAIHNRNMALGLQEMLGLR